MLEAAGEDETAVFAGGEEAAVFTAGREEAAMVEAGGEEAAVSVAKGIGDKRTTKGALVHWRRQDHLIVADFLGAPNNSGNLEPPY